MKIDKDLILKYEEEEWSPYKVDQESDIWDALKHNLVYLLDAADEKTVAAVHKLIITMHWQLERDWEK